MHPIWTDRLSFFAQVRFNLFRLKIDGSYYPWTYLFNKYARRTTCLYEIFSKNVFQRAPAGPVTGVPFGKRMQR